MHGFAVIYRDPMAWGEFKAVINSVQLPSCVQTIADVIGRDAALKLVAELPRVYSRGRPSGRAMLYVPKQVTPEHRLVQILGAEAAAKLARVFAGEVMLLAVCKETERALRNRAVEIEVERGASAREIGVLFCMSKSRSRHIRKELRKRNQDNRDGE